MGKLTDKAVQAAQPREKQYGISDGDSLALIVRPNGTKFWWFRYRYGGKAKTLSIGVYPIVSLREARDKVFEAKKKLTNNIDPSAEKMAVRAALAEKKEEQAKNEASFFECVAQDWFEKHIWKQLTLVQHQIANLKLSVSSLYIVAWILLPW